ASVRVGRRLHFLKELAVEILQLASHWCSPTIKAPNVSRAIKNGSHSWSATEYLTLRTPAGKQAGVKLGNPFRIRYNSSRPTSHFLSESSASQRKPADTSKVSNDALEPGSASANSCDRCRAISVRLCPSELSAGAWSTS